MHNVVTTIDLYLTMLPYFVVWHYALILANKGLDCLVMQTGLEPRVHLNV